MSRSDACTGIALRKKASMFPSVCSLNARSKVKVLVWTRTSPSFNSVFISWAYSFQHGWQNDAVEEEAWGQFPPGHEERRGNLLTWWTAASVLSCQGFSHDDLMLGSWANSNGEKFIKFEEMELHDRRKYRPWLAPWVAMQLVRGYVLPLVSSTPALATPSDILSMALGAPSPPSKADIAETSGCNGTFEKCFQIPWMTSFRVTSCLIFSLRKDCKGK